MTQHAFRWISEFDASYDVPGVILNSGLADVSWHNDACPAFGCNEQDTDIVIWVDHPDPARREIPLGRGRFTVTYANGEGDAGNLAYPDGAFYSGDDPNAALAAYWAATGAVSAEPPALGPAAQAQQDRFAAELERPVYVTITFPDAEAQDASRVATVQVTTVRPS